MVHQVKRGIIDGEYQDGEARGRVFISGATNHGKTFEMRRLLEQCSGGSVLYDHTGRQALRGAVIVRQPCELKNEFRRQWGTPFRLVYRPTAGDLTEHFRAVCSIVFATAGLVVGIDEIDAYCGPIWGDSRMPPELYKLVHYGRHAPGVETEPARGVALLYTARIPASIAPALRSQASELRLFHEQEPLYVKKYLEPIIGSEAARRLPGLQRFQFLIWRHDRPIKVAGGRR
jgi:hypothetical protein